jgi:arginase family enzyme
MRAVSPRFIACHRPLADARIVLFGIPFEGRVNLRKGADGGPRDLRLASDSIETYSPVLDRDLEDLALADAGDCELPDGAPPREQLDAAREQIAVWWRPELRPFMLGGDHTATVPVVEVLAGAFPDLRVVQFDAHPDLRDAFLGERYNYASAMARVMDVVPPSAPAPARNTPAGGHASFPASKSTRWTRCGRSCPSCSAIPSTSRSTWTCWIQPRRRARGRRSPAA